MKEKKKASKKKVTIKDLPAAKKAKGVKGGALNAYIKGEVKT